MRAKPILHTTTKIWYPIKGGISISSSSYIFFSFYSLRTSIKNSYSSRLTAAEVDHSKNKGKNGKSSRAVQIRRFFNKLHRILSRTKYFFLTKNFSTLHEKSRYIKRLGWFFFTFYRAPWSSCFFKIFCCKYLQSCTWISHDFSLKTHCVLDTNKILLNAQRQISVLKTSKQKKLIS